MDIERSKARVRAILRQVHSFEPVLFPDYSRQPTWEECHEIYATIADLSHELMKTSAFLANEYEKSLKEQEGIH